MKKLLLAAIAVLTLFAGCKEEEETITRIEVAEGETINMLIGDKQKLHIKHYPEHLSAPKIKEWKSSNNNIVTVYYGELVARSEGEALITVSTEDNISATCRVIVAAIEITEIKMDKSDYDVHIGETLLLAPEVLPDSATYKNDLVYTSTNEAVAIVGKKGENGKVYGEVKAVSVGECQIKIASADGKVSMTCNIKVLPIEVTKISLNRSEWPIEKGDTYQFSFWIEPENATDKTIKWVSSDNSVVTIAEDGTFIGVNIGECTITAVSSKAEIKAVCKVTVSPVSVKGISISQTEAKALIGTEITLQAHVTPANAVNQKIIWASWNPNVATVDSNGVVSCLSNGNAIITATSVEGGFSKSCSITAGGIDFFMSAKHGVIGTSFTVGGSFASMNYEINNSSNVDVVVKNAYINGTCVPVMSSIGSGQTLSSQLKGSFSSEGDPVVTWEIEYNGVEYIINSTYSPLLGLIK
ncbi:MAG: Ig domain-containing protein [Salinivirgaceae bacterium]|nr:Ig domain-containing protein [Salinivirgaceae bacterium]